MTKASDNLFPKIILNEAADDGSDFSNPAADYRVLFLGEDGELHLKDSSGTVTDVSGAGGDVATDAIWDAKGDLAVGTGADTAQKLTVGANGSILTAASGETTGLIWTPRFRGAKATNTAGTSLTGPGETAVPFATEDFDTDSFHDTSTNNSRITIPTGLDGYYLVTAQVLFSSLVTGECYAWIRDSGSAYAAFERNVQTAGSQSFNVSTVIYLSAADYVELVVYTAQTKSLSTTAGLNWLSIVKLD